MWGTQLGPSHPTSMNPLPLPPHLLRSPPRPLPMAGVPPPEGFRPLTWRPRPPSPIHTPPHHPSPAPPRHHPLAPEGHWPFFRERTSSPLWHYAVPREPVLGLRNRPSNFSLPAPTHGPLVDPNQAVSLPPRVEPSLIGEDPSPSPGPRNFPRLARLLCLSPAHGTGRPGIPPGAL